MNILSNHVGESEKTRRSTIQSAGIPILCALMMPTLLLTTAHPLDAQDIGTSCADCPNYSGAFSIQNETGVTISYQMRWGVKNPWKQFHLGNGEVETHSYPLGDDKTRKVPLPYVRFDDIGGDGRFTPKEYRMQFYAIGYAGFGPSTNTTKPKKYFFKYAAGGKNLDLFAR